MFWKFFLIPYAVIYREKLRAAKEKSLPVWKQKLIPRLNQIIDEEYRESRKVEKDFSGRWQLSYSVDNLKQAKEFYKLLAEVSGYSPIKKVGREEKYLSSVYHPLLDSIHLSHFSITEMVHEFAHHINFRDLSFDEFIRFWYLSFRYGKFHNEIFLKKEKEIFDLLLSFQELTIQNAPFAYLARQHTVLSLLRTAKLTKQIKKTWTIK